MQPKHVLLVLFLLGIFPKLRADFVDIATIRVNGKMIRNLTNNNQHLYLIDKGILRTGDTLNVKIWTDTGAENNATIVLRNLISNATDTLNNRANFLVDASFFADEHLMSVIFHGDPARPVNITWDICKFTPDSRIEKVYESVNALRDLIREVAVDGKSESMILSDSLLVNYSVSRPANKQPVYSSLPETRIGANQLADRLSFTKEARTAIEAIEAVDYAKIALQFNDYWSYIIYNEAEPEQFYFNMGDFTEHFSYWFRWREDRFVLYKITHHRR